MPNFSQRQGLAPTTLPIQMESMNEDLRTSLWNALNIGLWTQRNYLSVAVGEPPIRDFAKSLWFEYFKKPMDRIPPNGSLILEHLRDYFHRCKWNEVYDFLEFTVNRHRRLAPKLEELINDVLEREWSAYRFLNGVVVAITNENELEEVKSVLNDPLFKGASEHIQSAVRMLADRNNPDPRNSIKESISAVESVARLVSQNTKATLGDALKTMGKTHELHPAFKEGLLKMYGYTSDGEGIRHSLLEDTSSPSIEEARFFLIACSAFCNYLKSFSAK